MPTKAELVDYARANQVDVSTAWSKAEIEQEISDAGLDPASASSSTTSEEPPVTESSQVQGGQFTGPFPPNATFDPKIEPGELAEDASEAEANMHAWQTQAHSDYQAQIDEGNGPGEPESPAQTQERLDEAHEQAVAASEEPDPNTSSDAT